MEQDNNPQLADSFQPCGHHEDLDDDGGEGQEVVPGQTGVVRIPQACRQEHGEEGGPKDACPALLEAEDHKLGEPGAGAPGWPFVQEPVGTLIDQELYGCETPH
ncbi:hypothetical protein D9M72_508960 [compost metagenome]